MIDLKPIEQNVFLSEDVLSLAQFLLNKYLVSTIDDRQIISTIVETEAYKAPEDKASHAYQNKRTKRTETMFASGGISYVYLCYGIHNMLNVVTGPPNIAHAILIRAVEPITGLEHIEARRSKTSGHNLANGPGKVCSALAITRGHNALPLYDQKSSIYICDNQNISHKQVVRSPRVGIAYAEECAHWNWRFRIKDNPWTSPPHTMTY